VNPSPCHHTCALSDSYIRSFIQCDFGLLPNTIQLHLGHLTRLVWHWHAPEILYICPFFLSDLLASTYLSAIQYRQSIQVVSTSRFVEGWILYVKRLERRHRIQPFRRRRNDFKVRVVGAPCRPFHPTSYIALLLFGTRSYLVLLAWPRSVYLFGHRSLLNHSHPHLPSTLSSIRLEIYGITIVFGSITR